MNSSTTLGFYHVPSRIYFKYGSLPVALSDLVDLKRALIISDKDIFELGYVNEVAEDLREMGVSYSIFLDVQPDPKMDAIQSAIRAAQSFTPDLIVAVGGGSVMDTAKLVRLLSENPDLEDKLLDMRYMTNDEAVGSYFPSLDHPKIMLCCIPTTSGTGSEVTPFSVVTDEEGIKHPIAHPFLTPNMAIVDPQFVLNLPGSIVASSGMHCLKHAFDAYTSAMSNVFTDGSALEAISLVFEALEDSYKTGSLASRSKVHYASCIAGIAFGNTNLGIHHSLAHAMQQVYKMSKGIANALLLPKSIEAYCEREEIKARYVAIGRYLKLKGSDDEIIKQLVDKITKLTCSLELPQRLKDLPGFMSKEEYLAKIKDVVDYVDVQKSVIELHRGRILSKDKVEEILSSIYE
eukprot:TRINITY_DN3121_c1_g1_i1.p1 TRINITY_DN3121_c1_g1~~TRINITY_DN3121_c1_g1_i1.p1  ORF type:complete len:405 (+),score=135.98 TRINITY_DN3121_c1_g1_i1:60-1274(+)